MVDLRSHDAVIRDLYPSPGEPVKQWAVDERELARWARETCPTVAVWPHRDNTGADCRNAGAGSHEMVAWRHLAHDCCYWCGNLHQVAADRADIAAWRAEYYERKAMCCTDHSKLSDEIAPDLSLVGHPMLQMARKVTQSGSKPGHVVVNPETLRAHPEIADVIDIEVTMSAYNQVDLDTVLTNLKPPRVT